MNDFLELPLEERYQILDNIISLVPGHVYWKDKDGFFLGCNEEQAKSAGLNSRSEIVGKTDYELPWRGQAGALRKTDLKVIKTGKSLIFEEPSLLASGKKAIFLSKKVPLRNRKGEIIGILGVSTDITELKKTQEALQKAKEQLDKNNQAKAKLLRILQHDLRNKLTGILSFSEILLDSLNNKDTLKLGLEIIHSAAKSIVPTLDRINHYLSLETGQLKPYYSQFELNAVLKSFKEKYQAELSAKGISMEFELDPKIEGRVIGDYLLMRDVLDQLVGNAIKYTDKGKVSIETHMIRKQRDNVWVDILVRDTGPGMPQGVVNNLFKLFDYDPNDESKKYTTPGINLSISKKIAELLEGDLMVDSYEGKGTDFTFYIKLKIEKAPEKRYPFESSEMSFNLEKERESPFAKEKFQVLIIEDDLINQQALQALLSTYFHCDVLSAMDLRTGKELIANNPSLDLILTDIHLPDGEGHQIMPYLYQLHPRDDNLPAVVAVTAFAREVDMDYFFEQGILNVIPKPIALKELTEVIYRLFGEKVIKKSFKT